jgi:hypothetical protein
MINKKHEKENPKERRGLKVCLSGNHHRASPTPSQSSSECTNRLLLRPMLSSTGSFN